MYRVTTTVKCMYPYRPHLVFQLGPGDDPERLQVRVEAGHPGQRDPQPVLGKEPERHVVGEADGVAGALELTVALKKNN